MPPRSWRAAFCACSLALARACSSILEIDTKVDYKSASRLPPLEVPPDLTHAGARRPLPGPGHQPDGTATFSDYSASAPGRLAGTTLAVLPNVPNVHIERDGSQRWLVVKGTPEQVWPMVKDFWQENGFPSTSRCPRPESWRPTGPRSARDRRRPDPRIPQQVARPASIPPASATSSARGSSAARSPAPPRSTSATAAWTRSTQLRVCRPDRYPLAAAPAGSRPRGRDAAPPDGPLRGRRSEREGAARERQRRPTRARSCRGRKTGRQLALDEPFDRAWRRVGLVLDRVGFTVEDRDRSKGFYFVRYVDPEATPTAEKDGFLSKLMFWGNDSRTQDGAVPHRGQGRQHGRRQVKVLNKEGAPDSRTPPGGSSRCSTSSSRSDSEVR